MLETPSIRRYSPMSQALLRFVRWVVKIRSVRTISRKDSGTAGGLPVSSMGRLFQLPHFRNRKTTLRWQVQPTFVVVQSASSRDVLEDLARFFGCGKVYVNRRHDNHREDIYRYCVSRFADLRDVIVPFFQEHQLRTSKSENFEKFTTVLRLMEERKHLTVSGLIQIAEITETMNHRKPSKVLRILRDQTPTTSQAI
jgi:hypothetical protein